MLILQVPGRSWLSSTVETENRSFGWELSRTSATSRARTGVLHTTHGDVPTPTFMPVGTAGVVKTLAPWEVRATGARMLLANTYHLHLRPGEAVIREAGGLQRWTAWEGPMLTDSGGYQVMSLAQLRRIDDDGVTFRSHIDGSESRLTPESVLDIQAELGSDIAMVLDDLTGYPTAPERLLLAADRTARWAERAWRHHLANPYPPAQAVFGIIQGGTDVRLRRQNALQIASIGFDGYAIGGLSVGEPKDQTYDALEATIAALPQSRPRYLMGVGTPEDVVAGILRGVDMFDCAEPTRIARHGIAWCEEGRLNLRNARFRREHGPLDPRCECSTCQHFDRSYLSHLVRSGEVLGARALSVHNLTFLQNIVTRLRVTIEISGNMGEFVQGGAGKSPVSEP